MRPISLEVQPPAPRKIPIGHAVALVLSSLGFVAVGVVRMKLAAVSLGVAYVGAFGQAMLMQSLVLTLVMAGLAVSARISLSDGSASEHDLDRVSARLIRRPLAVILVCIPILSLLASFIARFYLGDDRWTSLFRAATIGCGPLVLSQAALAIVQTRGTRKQLVLASISYAVTGGIIVGLLVGLGSRTAAELSFVASPLAQLACLLAVSPHVRRACRASIKRSHGGATTRDSLARASLAVSILSLLSDTAVRAYIGQRQGPMVLADLQPAQLLATQAFLLVTASVTQAVTIDQNLRASRGSSEFVTGPWLTAGRVSTVLLTVGAAAGILSPQLIGIFFSPELASASSVVVVALAAEVIRSLAWLGGATLLPNRRVKAWSIIQVLWICSQTATTFALVDSLGAVAVPIGALVGGIIDTILLLAVLRPPMTVQTIWTLASVTALAVLLAASAVPDLAPGRWAVLAAAATLSAWLFRPPARHRQF